MIKTTMDIRIKELELKLMEHNCAYNSTLYNFPKEEEKNENYYKDKLNAYEFYMVKRLSLELEIAQLRSKAFSLTIKKGE